MSRRGDNIRKRKDGRWEARYPKGTTLDGKYRYASVYGNSYKEVKEKRQMILTTEKSARNRVLRLCDLLELWQASNVVRLKASSTFRYQQLIDTHINPALGGMRLENLSAACINSFLAEKMSTGRLDGQGGLSPAYVRSIALVINAAIDYGAAEHLCTPINRKVIKPPLAKREHSILSHHDQKVLETNLFSDIDATRLGILISLYAGLRIGEVCALSWGDVDLSSRILHVRHTVTWGHTESRAKGLVLGSPKTGSSRRSVPICTKLYHAFLKFKKMPDSWYVASGSSCFLNPRTLEYRYSSLIGRCGLAHINYHALRHTFATRCVEAGMDAKTLSEILGHADASVTLNTYVHSSMDMKRLQLEKISV